MSDVDKKTVAKISVQSMRADLLLKSGVGVARNKIEAAFYEGRIRVNGKKLLKKSHSCNIGDEIDYVKNESPTNPNHLIVSRVEIMSATPKDDSISVTMKRFKSLTIEKKD
jgi:23S rRNA-/tRNA-specific pseudouridylate synthase